MTEQFKIMVVDDNPSLSELVVETFNDEYRIFTFDSGEEALNNMDAVSPHLVLLDIMMPGMNGFEVCKAIRANKMHEGIKILFLSAKTALQDRLAGYEAAADDFLVKPFDTAELKAKVKVFYRLVEEEKKREQIVF
jgi:DNA-binding response OmpR family regulator